MISYEATEMRDEALTLEELMGDSYRQEIRKAQNHTGKNSRCVDQARAQAIRRAALRQKHRAVAWTASHRMATGQTPTQVRMF